MNAEDANPRMHSDELPVPEAPEFESLARSYIMMSGISWILITVLVLLANLVINLVAGNTFSRFLEAGVAPFFFAAFAVLLVLAFVMPRLSWRSQGYQLRLNNLHFKHGIVWRAVTSLPYVRVQHVELESGPVERLFKLATLKFFTAGGGSADMKIPGLPFATASKIRAYVMERAGQKEPSDEVTNNG